ncbi:MAG: right-handed parallel beta-helix repeat-containing protein, partial [Verrucomicrobiales bacterium]|nr:right-handed parallel beta-helix repeat-containing protein [Verrucomicrobiales bacterium]
PVHFSAASTAEALVFMHPLLIARETSRASATLGVIRADEKVQKLATVVASLWPNALTPFEDSAFQAAYIEAVLSVGRAISSAESPRARVSMHGGPTASKMATAASMDFDYLQLRAAQNENNSELGPSEVKVEAQPYNKVDWFTIVRRVDVDTAFPNGREDVARALNDAARKFGPDPAKPHGYPFQGGFQSLGHVEGQLFSSIVDLVEYVVDQFAEQYQTDKPILFPDESAVYLLRGVGPSFGDDAEEEFLNQDREGLRPIRHQAIALNLFHMTLDLLSALVDFRNFISKKNDIALELLEEEFRQLVEDAPGIHGKADLLEALLKAQLRLSLKLGAAFADQAAASGIAKASSEVAKLGGKSVTGLLEILSIISAVGEVGERIYGIVKTSPLESAFIVVGDPFGIDILGVAPKEAGPGDVIKLTISRGPFDIADRHDHVYFVPPNAPGVDGRITNVLPLAEGREELTVVLPEELQTAAEGLLGLLVTASGRRGENDSLFTLKRHPRVMRMIGTRGFAAVDDFLGAPFPGDTVALLGFDFGLDDSFFFGGAKAANAEADARGGVILPVPKGASSGPIRIERRVSATDVRVGFSPPFTVIGPPVIDSAAPTSGPVGTAIGLKVRNAGGDSVAVVFEGGLRTSASGFGEDFTLIVPLVASLGEIKLATPAGTATTTFLVTEGRAKGAELTVGTVSGCFGPTNSPITLGAALDLASGKRLPKDDFDERRGLDGAVLEFQDLDCAWDEGDFVNPDFTAYFPLGSGNVRTNMQLRWPVGAEYADTIIVTEGTGILQGDFVLEGSYDTLYASSITGSLTITGTNNVVQLDSLHGTRLLIEGDHNTVRGSFNLTEGILIKGGQNIFSGSVSNSTSHGLVITGNGNDVTVFTSNNSGDGLLIDGGDNNRVTVDAGMNGGNGVRLTGGANGNFISPATGQPFGPGVRPGTGNRRDGVVLTGVAQGNRILPHAPIGDNGGDGLHVEGEGVQDTVVVIFDAVGNSGHGLYIGGNASGTAIQSLLARDNRGDGLVLDGCKQTQIGHARAGFNGGDGIRINGIHDGETGIDSFELRDNKGVGLSVTSSSRLHLAGTAQGGRSGLDLSGAGSTENTLDLKVLQTSGPGATIRDAAQNRITLDARNAGDAGVIVSGAKLNELTVTAVGNAKEGLLLNGAAEANTIFATALSNQFGVVLKGAKRNVLFDLRANANQEHGLVLAGADTQLNRILRARVGLQIEDEPEGNQGDGIRIEAGANQNDLGSDAGGGPEIRNNQGAGIRVTGPNTSDTVILGATVTRGQAGRDQEAGIIVEDGALRTIIGGPQDAEQNVINENKIGIVLRSGATGTIIQNSLLQRNTDKAIALDDASANVIGDALPNTGNEISDSPIGIEISGVNSTSNRAAGNHIFDNNDGLSLANATSLNTIDGNNVIEKNKVVGLRFVNASQNMIRGNQIQNNFGEGILFAGGSIENDVRSNTIRGNATGVRVVGAGAVANAIRGNVITANDITGIDLSAGGNHVQPAPVITSMTSQSVFGTVDAPDDSEIEVFRDPRAQGEEPFGQALVFRGRFSARLKKEIEPNQVGKLFNLTATVTTPQMDTSEFGSASGAAEGGPSPIIFTSTRDGNEELYRTDGFAFSATRLSDHPAADRSSALSPDGKTVIFVSTREGNPEIHRFELADTAGVTRLTTHPAPDYDPAWSPNGTNVVFVSERDGNAEIYLMNTDGHGLKRLTDHSGADRHPYFSPDGTKIVFSSNRSGNFEIFVMNADGSNVQPLTSVPAADTHPAWSPDGELIAFLSEREGNAEIYTMNLDGSQLTRLTDHPATDTSPAWLTNGSALVFSSNRDEGFELYLIP